jgi:hypothetical protein
MVAVLVASTAAYGITRVAATDQASTTTSSTTAVTRPPTTATSTTTAPTTTSTTAATTTTGPQADDGVLEKGEKGEAVAAVQRRLVELHFDPGPADGSFGTGTMYAVQGFQKLAGMAPDGKVGPAVQAALADPPFPAPLVPNGERNRVEVDKARQLLFVYLDGNLRLISHVSTGSDQSYCAEGECGNVAHTPEGAFRFMWRYDGWRESRLGKLYNPVYFTGSGIAIHGSTSVPTYPASHGCVRIPMHIAEYFPSLVKRGGAVYVLSGPGDDPGVPPGGEPSGPPPSDPPTSPDTTPETTTTTAPSTTTTTAPAEESTTTTSTTSTTEPSPITIP